MITIKTNHLSKFLLTNEDFVHLDQFQKRHFTDWLNLTENSDQVLNTIKKFIREKKGSWDQIIAIGMGGSALGIVTLQKALFPFDNRLVVIDNLDTNTINHHLSKLDPDRTLVLIISKSGNTLETMTNYYVFKDKFPQKEYKQNFIAITDPQNGSLREIARKDGLTSFTIPPMIGGRFSVLTALGLLPLALLGGNMKKLLMGAKRMKERCLEKSENNPALVLAKTAHKLSEEGKNISTIISYSDQLFSLGLWYQQLLAESIGKSKTVGLTPIALRGASDQHSVLQLLQDGPNDKFNIFLDVVKPSRDIRIPENVLATSARNLIGKKDKKNRKKKQRSMHQILRLECHGTEQALREGNRPTVMIEIPEINEYNLGGLFMLFQIQVALLGELFKIDAFNQPGVEKSKKIIKAALSR